MKATLVAASLIATALIQPAAAQLFSSADEISDDFALAEPFGSGTLHALQTINESAVSLPQGRLLSINYRVGKQPVPGNMAKVAVTRTLRFDASWMLDEFDRIGGELEWTDCDRFRVEPADLRSVDPHRITVKMSYKLTKRECGWLGTHNTGSAKGWHLFAIDLTSGEFGPRITTKTLDSHAEASVFGMNPNNFFANVLSRVGFALRRALSNPMGAPLAIGRFHLDLLRPVDLTINTGIQVNPEGYLSPDQLAAINRAYGSLGQYLGNDDARNFDFSLAKSGFRYQQLYRPKPEYASKIDADLCTAAAGIGNAATYCQAIPGKRRLIVEIVAEGRRDLEFRSMFVDYYDEELRMIDSFNDPVREHLASPYELYTKIVAQYYGTSPSYLSFFRRNNTDAPCFMDSVQGRQTCRFRIDPLWMMKLQGSRVSGHPLDPHSVFGRAILDAELVVKEDD
ncbi:MAG: hypothetical protein EOP61_05660 [Sphingomonadales bacterium]|nr:MAG: hypothetical protein EOP61_05660 [Sphingomonadales bacterium]